MDSSWSNTEIMPIVRHRFGRRGGRDWLARCPHVQAILGISEPFRLGPGLISSIKLHGG